MPDDRRHRSAYQIASPFGVVSSPHVSFLLTTLVFHANLKFGITQLSQLVKATSSTSCVILKIRLFILLPPNDPPFLFICAPTTSLVFPIMADQHRVSIFGSRSIICRVLFFGHRSHCHFFHFLISL